MGWREQESLRKFRDAEQAAERAERERIEKPIREAEAAVKKNHAALIAIQRENVAKLRDDELYCTPELATARMSKQDAGKHNLAAAHEFIESTPEYAAYRTPENAAVLMDYFARNGIEIADASMFRAAFYRLRDLLLTEREPEPEPEPTPTAEPEPEPQPTERTITGRDYLTGLPKEFTEREVNRMSSGEYRRHFPVLPTMAEFFTVLKRERM